MKSSTECHVMVITFAFPRSAVVTIVTGPGSRRVNAFSNGSSLCAIIAYLIYRMHKPGREVVRYPFCTLYNKCKGVMDNKKEIQRKLYEIEDRIRLAPEGTSPRQIYEWYAETDSLRDEIDRLDRETIRAVPDETNVFSLSNADMEDLASEIEREEFVDQWNDDSDQPQTYSQIVGTAK